MLLFSLHFHSPQFSHSLLPHGNLQNISIKALEERSNQRQRRSFECLLPVPASLAEDLGQMGGRNQGAKEKNQNLAWFFGYCREAAMAYDEAARRLYGPDAYLNLPHLQTNSNSHLPNRFKWISSKNFISMFPSCGLLNINGQPSIHVIHQRLEELEKNNGALNQSSSSSSSSCESKTNTQIITEKSQSQIEILKTKKTDVDISSIEEMLQPEKPQIGLNEFLQQLEIVREEKQSQTEGTGEIPTESLSVSVMDSNVRDFEELAAFAEKSFNWDALIEMNGIGANLAYIHLELLKLAINRPMMFSSIAGCTVVSR